MLHIFIQKGTNLIDLILLQKCNNRLKLLIEK